MVTLKKEQQIEAPKGEERKMKKQIGPDFFAEYVNVSDMKPNGSGLFTYVRSDVALEEDKYSSDLYLFDMEKGKTVDRLTGDDGVHSVNAHEWLDADHLVILGAREKEDRLLEEKGIPLSVFSKLNVHTKAYEELFRLYHEVYKFCIIDAQHFLLLASESPVRDSWLAEADGNFEKYQRIREREERYFVADEVPFWSNSGGYCRRERGRVYYYDDGTLLKLHDDSFSAGDIASYGDEYGIFYGLEAGGFQKTRGKLYLFDYRSRAVKPIDESMEYIYTRILPVDSGHILALRNDRRLHGEYQDEYIDLIDLKDGRFVRNNKKTDWHLYDMVMTDVTYLSGWLNKILPAKDGFYFISTVGDRSNIYYAAYGRDDSLRAVTSGQGKILDYFVAGDTLWMSAMRGLSGGEFYRMDLPAGVEKRISDLNRHLEAEYEFPEMEEISFTNSDGIFIQGWAMPPVGCRPGEKYPAILFIHGGPECAYGPVAMHEHFAMCAEGMGVLFCNPRGSEGRGAEFMDIRTRWGTVDYQDLMEFTDHALAVCDWIDGGRLGVTGGSYGGIMTNWIIGHTSRFKAAVSDRGVSELFGDYFLGDIGMSCNVDTYGCTPWEDPEYLWSQSAVKYAPDIKTPVLFLHGMEDYRCPFVHSLILHSAITYWGGTSKVVGFKGENHELCRSGSPINRRRRVKEMLDWFGKYL